MKNLSITVKFLLLSGFSILALVGLGAYGLQNVYLTFTNVKQVYETTIKIERATRAIDNPLNEVRQLSLLLVTSPDQTLRTELQQRQTVMIEQMDNTFNNWEPIVTPSTKATFLKLRESWEQYKILVKFTAEQVLAGHREAAFINVSGAEQEQFKLLAANLTVWLQDKVKDSANVYQSANQAYQATLFNGMIIIVIFVVIVAIFSWFIGRMIINSLHTAVNIANSIADGDLNTHIEANTKEETGKLMAALESMQTQLRTRMEEANDTVERLTKTMGVIKEVSEAVQVSSEQISSGNESLSRRTEEQAAFLEQTVASMEEMTSTIQQNADNAEQSTQLAISAREKAERGGTVISSAILAMKEISESSEQVSAIISVIDEIAFQTNLLALNAAVEAARAGEQGRGFAVVATEVRNLAQRSATAAKEIKKLIKNSVERVDDGTKLVNQSGETLEEIVVAVKKVNDIISEIAAASQEQYAGITQINKAVSKMDEMTQQNALLVEEATQNSDNMRTQAESLRKQLVAFKSTNTDSFLEAQQLVVEKTDQPEKTATTLNNDDDSDWDEF
ncbi:methyl-accepting chemotaxis protein [Candidatus Albibeggiatoa sp. nov. NOAA]|uniref:methyl-accepting chemotaxis protein n=1 Tax=Candidatus Albibeggiatoa sp. nov. NOAA TaxID=3162724 RepID=UPI0032F16F14|nr:methyl-accepting chemotaxis protein [Thiotrichaceae bacterium]